jgi:adenosylmethionine-8-amino-7-oxononanoate aminotransferase
VRRKPYEDILPTMVSHIPPCYAYRHQLDGESDQDYGLRAAGYLEEEILRLGPERVAAFFAETVVGATAGAVPPAPGYFREIRRICDKYGVLLVLDEVMCGMGRTGSLYACEQDGVSPDMLTIAKALGGGYQPIGGLLASAAIVEVIRDTTGLFQHGHTYMGHAAAAAGALAVQKIIERDGLLAQVKERGAALQQALKQRLGEHPHIGDIRGRGLFIGVELVADRELKEPFAPHENLNGLIRQAAMEQGLLVYPSGGTVDGERGDHILLAPPFITTPEQVDEIADRLTTSIGTALDHVHAHMV